MFAESDTMINYSWWSLTCFPLWGDNEQMTECVPFFEVLKLPFTLAAWLRDKNAEPASFHLFPCHWNKSLEQSLCPLRLSVKQGDILWGFVFCLF